jgi:hypothetical protein
MCAAVHVDGSIGLRVGDVEHVDALQLWHVEDLETIGRHDLPRSACRLAAGIGLARQRQRVAIVGQCPGPWLQWHLIDVDARGPRRVRLIRLRVDHQMFVAPLPESFLSRRRSEVDSPVGPPRRRRRFCRASLLGQHGSRQRNEQNSQARHDRALSHRISLKVCMTNVRG